MIEEEKIPLKILLWCSILCSCNDFETNGAKIESEELEDCLVLKKEIKYLV